MSGVRKGLTEVALTKRRTFVMWDQLITFAEDLLMAPWWLSVFVCSIGNIFIWLIIPGYLAINRLGDNTDGILTVGYAGALPVISDIYNIAMALFFIVSFSYNLMLKKRRSS